MSNGKIFLKIHNSLLRLDLTKLRKTYCCVTFDQNYKTENVCRYENYITVNICKFTKRVIGRLFLNILKISIGKEDLFKGGSCLVLLPFCEVVRSTESGKKASERGGEMWRMLNMAERRRSSWTGPGELAELHSHTTVFA